MDLGRRTLSPTPYLAVLGLLGLGACAEVPAAACPDGTTLAEGELCRRVCSRDDDCLLTEVCSASICLPAPDDTFSIRRFDLAPTRVGSGEPIDVRYVVVGAERVELLVRRLGEADQSVAVLGEHVGTVPFMDTLASGTLLLRATRGSDTLEEGRAFEVDVEPPAVQIDVFEADATEVGAGEAVSLVWETTGATEVSLTANEADVAISGVDGRTSQPIQQTTTFRLTATNGTATDAAEVTVRVITDKKPVIVAFDTNRSAIDPGDTAALFWEVENAVRVEVKGEDGRPLYSTTHTRRVMDGAWVVRPQAATTYTLYAYGATQENVTATTQVFVEQRPAVPQLRNVEIEPLYTSVQSSGTISWQVDQPAEVTITDLNSGDVTVASGDSYTIRNTTGGFDTRQFIVHASNESGDAEQLVTMFQVVQEVEPNDIPNVQLQSVNNVAISGNLYAEVQKADVDNFGLALEAAGVIRIQQHEPCAEGVHLTLIREGNEIRQSSSTNSTCAQITLPSANMGPYRLRVDQTAAMPGSMARPYVIGVEVLPGAVCGNNRIEMGETCDDGGRANFDGCSGQCQREAGSLYTSATTMRAPPNAGTPVSLEALSSGNLDDAFIVIPLPFEFPFYGRRYGAVVLHSNGYLSLTPDFYGVPAGLHSPLGPSVPQTTLALFAADLRVPVGPSSSIRVHPLFGGANGDAIAFTFEGLEMDGNANGRLSGSIGIASNGQIFVFYDEVGDGQTTFYAGVEDDQGERVVSLPVCEAECVSTDALLTQGPFVYAPLDPADAGNDDN
ncbi:MAG: hypothetical protein RMA76_20640 [Deltaproteobacteria bacterium]|jgi:cysteine-rich repeat protein